MVRLHGEGFGKVGQVMDTFIWCYKTDCKYCLGKLPKGYAEDKDGKFGICSKSEIILDKEGRCSYDSSK